MCNAPNDGPKTGTGQGQHSSTRLVGKPHSLERMEFRLPGSSHNFASVSIRHDGDGRIASREITDGRASEECRFAYDEGGRLASVYGAGEYAERYSYGQHGERLSSLDRNIIRNKEYRYNERLQLLRVGDVKFEYDAQGRLAARQEQGGATTRYHYSSKGQLAGVALPDGRRIAYQCDAAGVRVAKYLNGVCVETYRWADVHILDSVADGQGTQSKRFLYEPGLRSPRAMVLGGAEYYLASDQVGTIFLVVNARGEEVIRLFYDSFGNPKHSTNPNFPLPLGFSGGLHDLDTGLVHFGFRDYDPTVGRFIQPDPIGYEGGDVDLYGYCLDDPVNLVDPLGLFGLQDLFGPLLQFGSAEAISPLVNKYVDNPVGQRMITSGLSTAYSGAVRGVTAGSTIGSIFGGVGAVPGAVAGALSGGFLGLAGGFLRQSGAEVIGHFKK